MHAGVAFSGILCQTAPRTSSHGSHSVMALNADPKKSATTVHVSVITLYGIEKSGVGKFTTAESGPMFMPRGVQRATRRRGTQAGDAAHTRHTTPKLRAAAPRASAAEAERTIASTREPHRTTPRAKHVPSRSNGGSHCNSVLLRRAQHVAWSRRALAHRHRRALPRCSPRCKGPRLRAAAMGCARAAIAGTLLPSVYSRR